MLKTEALKMIADKVSQCTLCQELTKYRTDHNYKTVPGEGNPNADVMFIGEAPGEDEAKSGCPFVGRAGQLLTKIIEAMGLPREQVYICNILKCRPPGNRVPNAVETKNCRKYLDLQIKTVNPKWVVCLGKTASVHLLGKSEDVTMGSLRGEHEYLGRKVICTYHPSYLLRNPDAKKDVWEDLQPIFGLQNLQRS